VIDRITAVVTFEPSITRSALSRQVCEWLGWRSPDGKPREVSCRKALLELDRRGYVKLPPSERPAGFSKPPTVREPSLDLPKVHCRLEELGRVEVIPVASRYSQTSAVWNELLERYHYLGRGPLCGAQIRYLIRSPEHGWLGGMSFSAAAWRLKDRERWIGWSDRARRANLAQVVCNSRFLILPSVEVPNLASRVLALSVARLAEDWQERYGYAPLLCETFVDEQQFDGACYRAANWTRIGETAGRSDGFSNGTRSSGPKAIYVLPLAKSWQDTLCREPESPLTLGPASDESADWAEQEFGGVEIYDPRLKARLFTMARDFFAQPGELVPLACGGSMAKTKAAYRFFDNPLVDMKTLLRGHVSATAGRVCEHPVVLAVQDTTTLSYTAHLAMEGLGPIGTQQDQAMGLLVHDTMAFTPDGTPLGLLDVQCWARPCGEAGKSTPHRQRPIEEKESFKWLTSYRAVAEVQQLCPKTMLVSIGDREADIYELFLEAQKGDSGPQLLIRSDRSRSRRVMNEEQAQLWDFMPAQAVAGTQVVSIPRRGSRPARKATLKVRHARVQLHPPKDKPLAPVSLWAVYAVEVNHDVSVKNPLEWMLLTTVDVSSFEQATERLGWYATRWGIEVYHRTLKSGCRIKDRRLENADRLESCLAIDLVVAWRIYRLNKQARETPEAPCDQLLNETEWKVLCAQAHKSPPPDSPPSLRDAVRMIAKLGGFLGRKGDGEPGTVTLWRGLLRLEFMVRGYQLYESLHRTRDGP
jgi:hypothetical protein